MYRTLYLLFVLCALASCESDQVTTTKNTTLEKKLVLNPTHLDGEQYVEYSFSAQVHPLTQPYVFYWDFDEGDGFELYAGSTVRHTFYQNRVYNVKVKAVGNDTTTYVDSIRVDIRPPVTFVELSPSLIDTILLTNGAGKMMEVLHFSITTSLPDSVLRTIWNFGDGTGEIVDSNKTEFYHYFVRPGTYTVHVRVYEKNDRFVGTDSSLVTIRVPKLTESDLSSFKSVMVFLQIDNTHPVSQDSLFRDPFGLFFRSTDFGARFEVPSGGKFDAYYDRLVGNANDFTRKLQDTVKAEFSSDFTVLRSLMVSVNDTGHLSGMTGLNNEALHYAYVLKDLELIAHTNSEVTYCTRSENLADFLERLSFRAVIFPNHVAGVFTGSTGTQLSPPELNRSVFGVITFTK